MTIPTLSIIIPTRGRPSLVEALESLVPAGLTEDDEVIVIVDGHDQTPYAEAFARSVRLPVDVRIISIPAARDWGHTPRNEAMECATGDRIVALDDDDIAEPGAYTRVRQLAAEHPDRPLVLRFVAVDGRVLPPGPYLTKDRVGTPAFVPLNRAGQIAPYAPVHGGDWNHIRDTVALQGEPVFDRQIIARCRRVN